MIEFDGAALLIAGVSAIGGGGVAWGTVTSSLRGVRKEQLEVKDALAKHTAADLVVQVDMVDRLARIETKLDALAAAHANT
jgi:hypothetical protein